MEIVAQNVNEALVQGMQYLAKAGVEEDSRNGPVLVAPEPVITTYLEPKQRVLFSVVRNANPFFHFFESLWMLAGRADVAFLTRFNKRMAEYSDDGTSFYGAYGWRWRNGANGDQLQGIVDVLKKDPQSRRAVLAMWNSEDLGVATKDLPCNTHVYFDLREGKLNMTVCNRSNDVWWGAYGANVVHFSYLQEYLACKLGAPVGVYRQFSNNYHVYTNVIDPRKLDPHTFADWRIYKPVGAVIKPYDKFMVDPQIWDYELRDLLWQIETRYAKDSRDYTEPFFEHVAKPMYAAWAYANDSEAWRHYVNKIAASDWRLAAKQWLQRKEAKRAPAP